MADFLEQLEACNDESVAVRASQMQTLVPESDANVVLGIAHHIPSNRRD